MTTKRIGFACKWIDEPTQIESIKPKDPCKELNTGSTTVRWLNEHKNDAEHKLWTLMENNIRACYKLVERVGNLEKNLRMVRLSSDILPVYTQSDWKWFWRQSAVRDFCEREFAKVGDLARSLDVRLSFHPGQFTVLASDNDGIVERSIEEFEYHTDMARWMGYGKTFQDFKCNVHISGRRGPQGIIDVIPRLSPEARNILTIENDEISWGIDDSIELMDHCALVLDIHHHWVHSGEYIVPKDDRFKKIVDSWRGVRPVIHYSVSREDVLIDHDPNEFPNLFELLDTHKRAKLRAHSNFYWNTKVNKWALSFLNHADIMCESKAKNLASMKLLEQAKEWAE